MPPPLPLPPPLPPKMSSSLSGGGGFAPWLPPLPPLGNDGVWPHGSGVPPMLLLGGIGLVFIPLSIDGWLPRWIRLALGSSLPFTSRTTDTTIAAAASTTTMIGHRRDQVDARGPPTTAAGGGIIAGITCGCCG